MCLRAQMCMSPLARLFCLWSLLGGLWSDISPKHVLRVAEAWGQRSGTGQTLLSHGASVTCGLRTGGVELSSRWMRMMPSTMSSAALGGDPKPQDFIILASRETL